MRTASQPSSNRFCGQEWDTGNRKQGNDPLIPKIAVIPKITINSDRLLYKNHIDSHLFVYKTYLITAGDML